ncbi:GL22019 [Drosophila persimilis]|uniref:Enhancer of split m4 protein n=2 Tax=pseudoobscura subgroup TaxID=32358 RepID=A0A6I8UQ83_DROPS|nr:enhancer of split m4 protein [Drosophila pseudoobscura]XP_002016901.1 enhancer of split m4 protein [Drosophila persimilis]XP_017139979.1 enhancer of split m4 protein [Drosophila miranda]EDW34001.1 GL22019 [Drosophila persimilis]
MCQNKTNDSNTMSIKSNKKLSYSVKKLLQKIFKQQQQQLVEEEQNLKNTLKANSLESLESIENSRNADLESASVCASMESYENEANERLSASCDMEDYELEQLPSVPVHFVRTAHGTFFWTAASDLPADNDLIEPLYCSTANEIAVSQFQDRWVQA